jgi:HSP20 family protein
MTNLLTRERQTSPQGLLEPFRMMREMLRWDPLREGTWTPGFESAATFMPSFEVKETDGAYHFKADLPGIKDEDLEIQVLGNRLTISGKREAEKKEENETYHLFERSFGSFSRTFTLPEEVEPRDVHAELKQGVLSLTIPKRPESKPQKVKIQS